MVSPFLLSKTVLIIDKPSDTTVSIEALNMEVKRAISEFILMLNFQLGSGRPLYFTRTTVIEMRIASDANIRAMSGENPSHNRLEDREVGFRELDPSNEFGFTSLVSHPIEPFFTSGSGAMSWFCSRGGSRSIASSFLVVSLS